MSAPTCSFCKHEGYIRRDCELFETDQARQLFGSYAPEIIEGRKTTEQDAQQTSQTSQTNKMNCELMLTYDTALRQTGSRNLTGLKTLPTIWGTYMKLVTKYQISAINSCRVL
jgi:hypothetical protein